MTVGKSFSRSYSALRVCSAAMLTALGVAIPMFMPLKLVLEPASFTLASHVPIFLAMFVSPGVALSVSLGTAAGFLLGGFPFVIVLRAATHVVFAFFGATYVKANPLVPESPAGSRVFSLIIALAHGGLEFLAVSALYFGGRMNTMYYESGFFRGVLLLVWLGTAVHSMVDFEVSLLIYKALKRQKTLAALFAGGVR